MSKPGSMRDAMPCCAGFMDELRAVFVDADGKPEAWINDHIRRGMKGEPVFYARENGQEIGTKAPEANWISLNDMVIGPLMGTEKGTQR